MRAIIAALALWALAAPAAWASELTLLARDYAVSPDLIAKFERETGITVHLEIAASHAEIAARLGDPPSGVDIVVLPDHRIGQLIEAGLLDRVLADRLPGFWNIEDPWRSRSFDPRNEYTVPHQWGTTAFAVDTSVHKGDIDTLRLLFDPPSDVVGHIVLLDDTDMVQLALLYLGEPRCTGEQGKLDRAVRVLAPLVAKAKMASPNRLVASLQAPDTVLGVSWNGDAMRARDGRPALAYAYPAEGNLVWTDVAAVPRNPPNRSNALKFLAFLLRPENAALESNFNGYANVIRGSEAHMLPAVLAAPELVAPWPGKVAFHATCRGAVQRLHDRAWAEAKARAIILAETR